jgi:lipopolysaccharide transport system ATP-binding protein
VGRPLTVVLLLDRLDLEPGSYRVDVGVYERDWAYVYDYHWQAYPLELVGGGGSGFGPRRRWTADRH